MMRYVYSASFSIIMHATIIIWVIFLAPPITKIKHIGYPHIITARLTIISQPAIISRNNLIATKSSPPAGSFKKTFTGKIKTQKNTTKHNSQAIHHSPKQILHIKQSGQYRPLLIALHNAIQQEINNNQYLMPTFIRTKTATISFNLSPQGEITNIKIIKKSGITTLDNLAQQAVKSIQPFTTTKKYLSDTKQFNITIYFK